MFKTGTPEFRLMRQMERDIPGFANVSYDKIADDIIEWIINNKDQLDNILTNHKPPC